MRSRQAKQDFPVLSSAGDISRLRASPRRLWALRSTPIAIKVPELDAAIRAAWEARLNALGNVCGCTEAAVVGAIATILAIVGWLRLDLVFTATAVLMTVFGVIGIALLAKFARLLLAQFQLRRALAALLRDISNSINSHPHGETP